MPTPIDPKVMRDQIRSTLQAFDRWNPDVEELVLGTIAHESHLGQYRRQIGGGPALGIAQMEPATLHDCWDNFLEYHQDLVALITTITGVSGADEDALENNDPYAIIMCRVKYLRSRLAIPPASDVEAQAEYWFHIYNGSGVVAKVAEYVADYRRLVLEDVSV